jgi:hypothetical protein
MDERMEERRFMPHLVNVGFIHCARNIPPSKAMPSDSWQRLIVRRIVIGPVLSVGGGFFFLPETAAARLLRLCVRSGDLLAAYGLVHQRQR